MHNYPVILTQLENGQVMAEFPDVPEALTYGATEESALENAKDALYEALDLYMTMRKDIPTSGQVKKYMVSVDPMVEIKLSIYQAMREKGLTQERLASILKCDARQIRRLLDIFHNSTLPQLVAALNALDYHLEVQAVPAYRNMPGILDMVHA
ncbi:MAG: type II toxin-antitoxin system HicB family antitoxin [Deltaproteobacteria bacterium]|jgi:antitoxin HicB|nr:type II toxin-antitoxin system HicB family antitoxin [Deltaproteobacteria bacterium]